MTILCARTFSFRKKFESFFKGAETSSKYYCGISTSGDFVESDYFSRLFKLGDFRVATDFRGGYPYPYLDFGITEIYQKLYFVIGMIFYLTKTKNYLIYKINAHKFIGCSFLDNLIIFSNNMKIVYNL